MATQDEKDEIKDATAEAEAATALDQSASEALVPADASTEVVETHDVPAHLGALKYVHAAFFAAGILIAYLSNKIINTIWNQLANWPAAVKAVPQLQRFTEEEREAVTLGVGALIGLLAVVQAYRKEGVRRWADEVATELSRVTWPSRETVMNGTLVVIIASMVATVYVAILDRFWSFLTTLVYGA